MTRDELIKIISDDFDADASPRSTADRILPPREPTPKVMRAIEELIESARSGIVNRGPLLAAIAAATPPREPTPAMVEAMVPFVYGLGQQCYDNAHAAWAAGYAAGEKQ